MLFFFDLSKVKNFLISVKIVLDLFPFYPECLNVFSNETSALDDLQVIQIRHFKNKKEAIASFLFYLYWFKISDDFLSYHWLFAHIHLREEAVYTDK